VALEGLTTVNTIFCGWSAAHECAPPCAGTGGTGISLVGHHEVLIPLLAAAVIEASGA
jgi:hypothetical protein